MELTKYLSRQELQHLLADRDKVRQDLVDNLNLNTMLSKPINTKALRETKLLLEGKPIPIAKKPRLGRNSKVVRKVSPEEVNKLWR